MTDLQKMDVVNKRARFILGEVWLIVITLTLITALVVWELIK